MVRRIAVIADVHGNAPALAAVLAEAERNGAELLVSCGDLTWGPLPRETLELLEPWRDRARFVRGNADRALGEDDGERARWLRERHGAEAVAFVTGFEPSVVVDHAVLGPIRFTHGSPRSDEECVTVRTPVERVRQFLAGVAEGTVFTAHTHVQYDRVVDGVRLVNAGSVGMPYEGAPVRTGRSSARTSSTGERTTTWSGAPRCSGRAAIHAARRRRRCCSSRRAATR